VTLAGKTTDNYSDSVLRRTTCNTHEWVDNIKNDLGYTISENLMLFVSSVVIHTLLPATLLILTHVKHTIPFPYTQPSS
jgi:hypothetical protein